MLQQADWQLATSRQCFLLGDMLSSQAKHTPALSEHIKLELAVGAALAGLQATTQHASRLVKWLVQHIKVVQIAEQSFQCFLTHSWPEAQRLLCSAQQTPEQTSNCSASPCDAPAASIVNNSSSNSGPPSIRTVVTLPDNQATASTASTDEAGDYSEAAPVTAKVADVKATVSSHAKGRREWPVQQHVVWRLPLLVNEAQAAVLRKIATLCFRLDRQREVELVLRVAVS